MPKKLLNLLTPIGGLDKSRSFQAQPPYTTPACLNVFPRDIFTGRQRIGTRPELDYQSYNQISGGSNPVRLLASVQALKTDKLKFLSWDSPPGSTGVPSDWATASDYRLEMFLVPYKGLHSATYIIDFRMNGSDAVTVAGARLSFTIASTGNSNSDTISGTLTVYVASVGTPYSLTTPTGQNSRAGWLSVLVQSNTVKVYWLGEQILSQAISAAAGSVFAFSSSTNAYSAGQLDFDRPRASTDVSATIAQYRLQYYATNPKSEMRNILVASANGALWVEGMIGIMATIGGTPTLASDRPLSSAERLQKLYIADTGEPRVTGTAGTTNSGAGTLLDDAAVSDWTALGITAADDLVEITSGTGATAGTYVISSIHATNGLTLTTSPGVSASSIVYRVIRGPKVFDPVAATLARWVTTSGKGYIPVGCSVVAEFRDSLYLAGDPNSLNVWYKSRQGDPLDFDFTQPIDDPQRAMYGTTSEAGNVGDAIRALIPHGDGYMFFGCGSSIWRLRGDPAYSGAIDRIATVGIQGMHSWCETPEGHTVMMTTDGLYLAQAGSGSLIPVSKDRLPREFLNLDPTMYDVWLTYDNRAEAVLITGRARASEGTSIEPWLFDWKNKGFWPADSSFSPTVGYAYKSRSAFDSGAVFASSSGYLLRLSPYEGNAESYTDDTCFCTYGPFRLGSARDTGMLMEIMGVLAHESGLVKWMIGVGDSEDEALRSINTQLTGNTEVFTGTWNRITDVQYTAHPRARGRVAFIRVSSSRTDTEVHRPWAIEEINAVIERKGVFKLPA